MRRACVFAVLPLLLVACTPDQSQPKPVTQAQAAPALTAETLTGSWTGTYRVVGRDGRTYYTTDLKLTVADKGESGTFAMQNGSVTWQTSITKKDGGLSVSWQGKERLFTLQQEGGALSLVSNVTDTSNGSLQSAVLRKG